MSRRIRTASFIRIASLAAGLAMVTSTTLALAPSERLADPAQEARARDLSAELRCLVCQNQSIDDSDAELARDLRRLVRERIAAGDSDTAVKSFLVNRYGEFVLLKPTFSFRNALLWLLPFGALIAGFFASRKLFTARAKVVPVAPVVDLTGDEQAELDRIVSGENPRSITKVSPR